MNVFAAIVTTTAVLIHSVLGCCWHHSHVCDVPHAASAVQTPHESHPHTCTSHAHHQRTSSGSLPVDAPCDGDHSCDDTACGTTAIVQANVKSPVDDAVAVAVVVCEPVIDGQDSRFAATHSVAAVRPQTAVLARALTQTWLL